MTDDLDLHGHVEAGVDAEVTLGEDLGSHEELAVPEEAGEEAVEEVVETIPEEPETPEVPTVEEPETPEVPTVEEPEVPTAEEPTAPEPELPSGDEHVLFCKTQRRAEYMVRQIRSFAAKYDWSARAEYDEERDELRVTVRGGDAGKMAKFLVERYTGDVSLE